MRLSTLAIATAALAGSASAQPIVVLNAAPAPRSAQPASDCAPGPADGSADIECVLSLTPPRRGAEPEPPRRILIRAQWAAKPCLARGPQVVDLPGAPARTKALPVVDQAGAGRTCRS
ncbi:MAG: hypothetical protein KKB47_23850 [Alphaproteobacteria bacterium]|nr:hypothetical protein [Alphaproteobacteria bacterium]MBU1516451.1 hypothetical protein [Alphaproteobacteria bacterium]MBU2094208.1 hypothetical protein [Alphaproteobacteria bacterium]MBU2307378.1 hypothetical protein [Alphaproteobacteria bacterium]MBU2365911.1 hypothetical protein [Alphaproteobacteria bacterium]